MRIVTAFGFGLALLLPTAGAVASQVSFDVPAQANGVLTLSGPATFLLVGEPGWNIEIALRLADTTRFQTFHQRTVYSNIYWPDGDPNEYVVGSPSSVENSEQEAGDAILRQLAGSYASVRLAVFGSQHLNSPGSIQIGGIAAGSLLNHNVWNTEEERWTFRREFEAAAPSSTWRIGGITEPAQLSLDGRFNIEWHGFKAMCGGSQSCFPPAGYQYTNAGQDGLAFGQVQERTWIGIESANGSASLTFGNATVVAIVENADATIDGIARLPGFAVSDCVADSCPKTGQTLQWSGIGRFENLQTADGRRLFADLSGDPDWLRFDEQIVDPNILFGTATMAASATAAAGLLFVIGKLLLALFTRISARDALEHPRRKAIMEYVKEHPGATFREVLRGTEIPAGTARHHLTIMRRSGLITEKRHRATLRFFENHGKYHSTWAAVVLLREEPLKDLHEWIVENPECKQMDIIEAMEGDGWTRSTTQHRLRRLLEGGLVTARPQGRLKLYTAHDTPKQPPRDEWIGLDDRSAAFGYA